MSTKIRRIAAAALTAAVAAGLIGAVPAQGAQNPEIAFVTGRVTLGGEPQRAEVRLVSEKTRRLVGYDLVEKTDAAGYFTFSDAEVSSHLRDGKWVLVTEPMKPAHATYYGNTVRLPEATPIRFAPGETITADIELIPAAKIKGRIVDAKGRPVKGVRIHAEYDDHFGEYRLSRTDADGRYVIGGVRSGHVKLRVYDEFRGKWDEPETSVTAVRGETVTAPDLAVRPSPKDGKITAKITRLKKNDAIWLFNTKTRHATSFWAHATSYKFVTKKDTLTIKATLPAGTYRVVVGGTNVASKAFTVKPNKTTKVPAFKGLKKRTTLTGKLKKANGKTLDWTSVDVYDAYGTPSQGKITVKKGKYRAKGLGKGFYSVKAGPVWGEGPDRTVKTVVIKKKKAKRSLKLTATSTMTGTISHGGEPVRGIDVYLVRSTATGCIEWADTGAVKKRKVRDCFDDYLLHAKTDALGRYTMENAPVGQNTYIVHDPNAGGYSTITDIVKVKKSGTVWNVALDWN